VPPLMVRVTEPPLPEPGTNKPFTVSVAPLPSIRFPPASFSVVMVAVV